MPEAWGAGAEPARVALVVGDVAGQGLYATATMGRPRTAVRTLADLELDPTELLTHLDDLVQQFGRGPDPFVATCPYAEYDPVARRCALPGAGHPPPVLVTPAAVAEAIDVAAGPPLGVVGLPFETVVVDIEPGSVLACTPTATQRKELDLTATGTPP